MFVMTGINFVLFPRLIKNDFLRRREPNQEKIQSQLVSEEKLFHDVTSVKNQSITSVNNNIKSQNGLVHTPHINGDTHTKAE